MFPSNIRLRHVKETSCTRFLRASKRMLLQTVIKLGSYLIHLFRVRIYSGQAEFQSSIREQLHQGGVHVVGVERSHDQTKWQKAWIEEKLPQILALKQQTQKSSASKTISWFESLSDSELLLSSFMKQKIVNSAVFVYCSTHVPVYLIHRVTTEYAEMFCLTWFTSSSGSTLNTQNRI